MGVLDNLKLLKEDMTTKNWTICCFLFEYKRIEYIVLVKRFVNKEKRINKYALVKLHFMKSDDLQDDLEVEANCSKLLIEAKDLRTYFGIEYSENLGEVLQQFSERFGRSIPISIPSHFTDIEKVAMIHSLSKSDSEDPTKIFCTKVRRNPESQKRSPFNSDKTKLLRESLFVRFLNEESISFCYSADPKEEKDDTTILKNLANNDKK